MKEINVTVTFLTEDKGGRSQIPERFLESKHYRPHFVPCDADSIRSEDYMGVSFISQKNDLLPGHECEARVVLMYEGIDYSRLVKGFKFDIVEGQRIVGSGYVH